MSISNLAGMAGGAVGGAVAGPLGAMVGQELGKAAGQAAVDSVQQGGGPAPQQPAGVGGGALLNSAAQALASCGPQL